MNHSKEENYSPLRYNKSDDDSIDKDKLDKPLLYTQDDSFLHESDDEKEYDDEKDVDFESMDFQPVESMMWRQHYIKRYVGDSEQFWNPSRRSTAYKWVLVLLLGVFVALIGALVDVITDIFWEIKLGPVLKLAEDGYLMEAGVLFLMVSVFFAFVAGGICMYEPFAAGSGIPEVKAYLNGVKILKFLRIKVLMAKAIGVCFSCASGLPLGKEGPMVHIGSIMGAGISQGKKTLFGYDTSWTKFQDLRNDPSKRDFVTFGAAAGIAAAFRAPLGGILFTLEEGASFWSTTLIFRSFLCATMTQLTISLIFLGRDINSGMMAFGSFDNIDDGLTNYRSYELLVFLFMGAGGGLLGSFFNHIYLKAVEYRKIHGFGDVSRLLELMTLTAVMAIISFGASISWDSCTPVPTSTADWSSEERRLLDHLVPLQCEDAEYNQVASLYLVPPAVALRQLFHYREYDGSDYETFSTSALLIFTLPYFLLAGVTAGAFAPVGLFVPSLLSGAGFGRIIGHLLNKAFPGEVADSGTYALIGAAAMLGGIGRMTIAGTVIVLEACGNTAYLLPLMLTFGAARYSGNIFNGSIYDVMMEVKNLPFLEGSPPSLGLVNYQPVVDYMAKDIISINLVESVSTVHELLTCTKHNGFPVVNASGHFCGFILRKHLTTLLYLRAFSYPVSVTSNSFPAYPYQSSTNKNQIPSPHHKVTSETDNDANRISSPSSGILSASTGASIGGSAGDASLSSSPMRPENSLPYVTTSNISQSPNRSRVALKSTNAVFHETLESTYPRYPAISDVNVSNADKDTWLDLRPYVDSSYFSISHKASVNRAYRMFRTMGLRHLVVINDDHRPVGMLTRHDITHKSLEDKGVVKKSRAFEFSSLPYQEQVHVDLNNGTFTLSNQK